MRAIMRVVRRVQIRRLFAAALFSISIGAPVLEMFDRWDHTLQDGNDTETNLVVLVLCVGVGFIAATRLLRRICPSWTGQFSVLARAPHIPNQERRYVLALFDASSPPATLRI